jgi:hypothetical protein
MAASSNVGPLGTSGRSGGLCDGALDTRTSRDERLIKGTV